MKRSRADREIGFPCRSRLRPAIPGLQVSPVAPIGRRSSLLQVSPVAPSGDPRPEARRPAPDKSGQCRTHVICWCRLIRNIERLGFAVISVPRGRCGAARWRPDRPRAILHGTSASSHAAFETHDGLRRSCDASWDSWSPPSEKEPWKKWMSDDTPISNWNTERRNLARMLSFLDTLRWTIAPRPFLSCG